MSEDLELKIEFHHDLTKREQMVFWESIVDELEKLNVIAGGGQDNNILSWTINISKSSFDKSDIIDRLGDFLLDNDELVMNWEIK